MAKKADLASTLQPLFCALFRARVARFLARFSGHPWRACTVTRSADDTLQARVASMAFRMLSEWPAGGSRQEGIFKGKTVLDVVDALRSGALKVSDVPINYIVHGGDTIILNTRSSQALEAAGIARSEWNAVNRTGDQLYEGLLDGQLARNPGGPFDTVVPRDAWPSGWQ